MPKILPISQLSGNPDYISKLCHGQDESIFLTRDGYGDMVIMSMERYETLKSLADAYLNQLAGKTQVENNKNNSETVKIPDKEDFLNGHGIEKLPLEEVAYIMKQELHRRVSNDPKQKRFP